MRSANLAVCLISLVLATLVANGAVVLSEIMYDPDGDEATDEFIELFNSSVLPANLADWLVSDGESADTLVDAGMGLLAAPNQYILILDPDYISDGSTGYDGVVSEDALIVTVTSTSFGRLGLSNSDGETVSLFNASGALIGEYEYSIGNEQGYSDEKIRPTSGDSPSNWLDSEMLLGTPGFRNSVTPPDRDIALLSCTSAPPFPSVNEPFDLTVRLLNRGIFTTSNTVRLSNDPSGGREWSVVDLRATGDVAPADTVDLVWQQTIGESGVTRYFVELTANDDDTTNNRLERLVSGSAVADGLVLNEIQAAPLNGRSEWVELAVAGNSPVSLSGVKFSDGAGIADTTARHSLPDLVLSPSEFMVLATDSSIFVEAIPASAHIHVFSPNSPTLNNSGDSLVLFGVYGDVLERVDYRASWNDGSVGTSLERISYGADVNDPANWASSVDAQLATPGRVNSRSISAPRRATKLSVVPSPFTPNEDGRDDFAEVRYALGEPASKIDVLVFDVRGRQVRRLAGGLVGMTEGAVIWDGRGDDGVLLPTARYIIVLEAESSSGSVSRERATLVLARPK